MSPSHMLGFHSTVVLDVGGRVSPNLQWWCRLWVGMSLNQRSALYCTIVREAKAINGTVTQTIAFISGKMAMMGRSSSYNAVNGLKCYSFQSPPPKFSGRKGVGRGISFKPQRCRRLLVGMSLNQMLFLSVTKSLPSLPEGQKEVKRL